MHDPVAESLRQFISDSFLFGMDATFTDEDSLLEQGIVDSTGVMELIAHLESEYAISISDDELIPENLDSITNLSRFIHTKKAQTPAPKPNDSPEQRAKAG